MRIGIYYFSGTGNTEIIAKLLSENFSINGASVELFKMDELLKTKEALNIQSFDMIGIGHPVLGFGPTGITDSFIDTLPVVEGKPTFIFKTASSHHYVNQGASETIIKVMKKKGYKVFHNSIFAMPCNWYLKYEDSMNKQLYGAALIKTKRIAKEILKGEEKVLRINGLLAMLFKLVYFMEENLGAKYFSDGLTTNEKCNLCKKCVKDCPSNNIYEKDGRIQFRRECVWCMRCVYACPKKAIVATHIKECVLEPFTGGFNYKKILEDPTVQGDFVTEKTKGYFKHFIKYFRETE